MNQRKSWNLVWNRHITGMPRDFSFKWDMKVYNMNYMHTYSSIKAQIESQGAMTEETRGKVFVISFLLDKSVFTSKIHLAAFIDNLTTCFTPHQYLLCYHPPNYMPGFFLWWVLSIFSLLLKGEVKGRLQEKSQNLRMFLRSGAQCMYSEGDFVVHPCAYHTGVKIFGGKWLEGERARGACTPTIWSGEDQNLGLFLNELSERQEVAALELPRWCPKGQLSDLENNSRGCGAYQLRLSWGWEKHKCTS